MSPVLVNGLVALTGIASAVLAQYVADPQASVSMGAYALVVFGYCIKRFGDEKPRPEIERDAP